MLSCNESVSVKIGSLKSGRGKDDVFFKLELEIEQIGMKGYVVVDWHLCYGTSTNFLKSYF